MSRGLPSNEAVFGFNLPPGGRIVPRVNSPEFPGPPVEWEPVEMDSETLHTIEVAAQLTRVPRRRIALYCRHGLVAPVRDPDCGGWLFNDDGLRAVSRVEQLYVLCGLNLAAIRLILSLQDEVERLQQELRFWRRQ